MYTRGYNTLSIWWDAIQANMDTYLVRGKMNALIDSGPPQSSLEPMATALKSHGLVPADIGLVLNTHGHSDHIGGNAVLKAAGNAQIFIHRSDALFLEDHALSFDWFYAVGMEHDLERQKAALLQQLGPEVKVDRYLADGDRIDLGDGIVLRVIHIPGHTPGSCGYYWESEQILFAGDSVQGISTPGGFLPILCDCAAYEKSLERLQALPIRTLLLSHPYRGIHLPPSLLREGEAVGDAWRIRCWQRVPWARPCNARCARVRAVRWWRLPILSSRPSRRSGDLSRSRSCQCRLSPWVPLRLRWRRALTMTPPLALAPTQINRRVREDA